MLYPPPYRKENAVKILILEDDVKRQEKFKRNLIGHQVTIVDGTKQAIALLAESDWDLLCLDHDLNGMTYVPSGPNTGYEVAVWIEQNPNRAPKNIILHSLNDKGRGMMAQALQQFRPMDAPFAWDYI
jgi:CheY-like chemotaxis protein